MRDNHMPPWLEIGRKKTVIRQGSTVEMSQAHYDFMNVCITVPFWAEINYGRRRIDSPQKFLFMESFYVLFVVKLTKLSNKQQNRRWSEIQWRYCDDVIYPVIWIWSIELAPDPEFETFGISLINIYGLNITKRLCRHIINYHYCKMHFHDLWIWCLSKLITTLYQYCQS